MKKGMGMYKKIIAMIVLIIMFCNLSTVVVLADEELNEEINYEELEKEVVQASSETNKEPVLNSRAAIIFDRTSKDIIWGKNENVKRPMASTTKIMTAIVVLENCNLSDVVEVSKKAAGTGGSRLGLKTGDKVTVHDLLYGLLLVSGNDAAVALAEHVGGSVESFASMMNEKASKIGLKNSSFVTPHGLDMPEHYTTAYELALMADYALNIPKFADIVGTKLYTATINGYPKALSNTNELLGNLEGVNGVKTGFTNGANRCLVTSVKRDSMNIITVVLGADTKKFRTLDSVKLIKYAYDNYKVINSGEMAKEFFDNWKNSNEKNIYVNKGIVKNLEVQLDDNIKEFLAIKKENEKDVNIQVECIAELEAPVEAGTVLGKLQFNINEEEKFSVNIIAKNSIRKMNVIDYCNMLIKNYTIYLDKALN